MDESLLSKSRFVILGALCIVILWKCAHKVAPSGGPEDKTPPEILSTFPAPDSTNIKELPYLEFQFSENVNKSSISNENWLLPELPNGYEIEWKGSKKLRIILMDSLEEDQTYIFTIGTGLKDLRGNSLPSPFVLPFATGDEIDRGEISGKVFEKNPRGIFVYAYQISDTFSAQTVFRSKPRYYTQVDQFGEYQLKYLNEAAYRVYALEDKNGDRKYTLQTDRIGIPFKDITIDSQQIWHEHINFSLIREDTTRPQFVRVDTLNNRRLQLSFNEPLDVQQPFSVEIRDSLNQTVLPIVLSMLNIDEPGNLMVYTEPQEKARYVGLMSAVQDTAGNLSLSDTIEFYFTGAADSDTTTPQLISVDPQSNTRSVDYDEDIELLFSLPVDSSSLKNAFQLFSSFDTTSDPTVTDTTLYTTSVEGEWRFLSLKRPVYIPDTLLEKNKSYQVHLSLPKIKTIFGDSVGDSLFISHFQTKDWAQLGEIAGVVFSDNPQHLVAIIRASPLRGMGVYSASAKVGDPYLIRFLSEGMYQMRAGIDTNQNGKIDQGSGLPFEFAEPLKALPDTIKVRKRWTTEGVNFRF